MSRAVKCQHVHVKGAVSACDMTSELKMIFDAGHVLVQVQQNYSGGA